MCGCHTLSANNNVDDTMLDTMLDYNFLRQKMGFGNCILQQTTAFAAPVAASTTL